MASIIKADTLQSTTANVFVLNSAGTEYARFHTTDGITFSNGGAERVRITNDGNVGIGTTGPSNFGGTNLQVANTNIASVVWTNGTYTGQLLASASAEVTVGSRSNHVLRFATNDTERARIDTSGNVMIGTTTSQTGAKLAVTGGIQGTITSGTAVATTSGTSIDFTSIPSWVKRVTVMLATVSTNGSSSYILQLGTSGGIVSTGYNNCGMNFNNTSGTNAGYTNGFNLKGPAASDVNSGSIIFTNLTSNTWTGFGMVGAGVNTTNYFTAGSIALGGTLDRVRITTANGTDTFDAGSINILYEG